MFLIKLIVSIFAFIPYPVVMFIARLVWPVFRRAVFKGKWGLKVRRIIPKVFKEQSPEWHHSVLERNALHLARFAGETLKARFASDRRLEKQCYIAEGEEYIEELCNAKTGFTILTCHLGNWEWGGAYIAYKYRHIFAPVFVEDSAGNRGINWIRKGHNVHFLDASRDPRVSARTLSNMIRLIRDGEIIYLVADQAPKESSFKGMFFGKQLPVFGGPFIIGRKMRTPFLPYYTLRDEKNRIGLHFEEPFYLNGDADDVRKVTGFFERVIGAHPEQYLWSQDRWN